MDTKSVLALLLGLATLASGQYPFGPKEYQFDTALDHFANGGFLKTFKLRYIVDAQYWDPSTGPILFYAGNEGDIWNFYQNSGFMTTTVPQQLNGLVVFCEHRYFGKSFPFPKEDAFKPENNVYLTVEQTMMDYVEFIKFIRYTYGATDKPCIVYGGSYGGMLASWIRMKYPATFQGAYASSAPILSFQGAPTAPENAFNDIITNDFNEYNQNISSYLQETWKLIKDLKTRPQEDKDAASQNLQTCQPLKEDKDFDNLYTHYMNGYSYMAMTDYPYASNFLNPMPANPVQVAASFFNAIPPLSQTAPIAEPNPIGALSPREILLLTALNSSTNVYYNYNSQNNCTNFNDVDGTGSLDGAGWNVLACNQLAMPQGNSNTSMFVESNFNYSEYTSFCQKTYGLSPRYNWALDFFGGMNIQKDFRHYSNIIFTNGKVDPWSAGGVTTPIKGSPSIKVIVIPNSAHHLELRLPNPADPVEVVNARATIVQTMQDWIKEYRDAVKNNLPSQ